MLKVGDAAPDFSLRAGDGKTYSPKKLKGKRIVIYFYPKDNTPGCTIEGCAFRNNMAGFRDRNAVVLGVSADSVESHKKFAARYGLNFPLLSDAGGTVSKKYGVWKEKNFLGKKYMGIERSTFIIDGKGKIAAMFLKVNPLGHANAILNALNLLKDAGPNKLKKKRSRRQDRIKIRIDC
ncbi:MAG: thioredoxin-dependent thiol peroxidase [Candidatus Micrarchaeota archaeon]